MAVNLSPIGGVAGQFFDNNGDPLTGGKIYTYAAGTTTPQATYTSATGTTPHANPIILDAAGRVPGGEIWLTDSLQYKFVIQTSNNVLIGTYDNIIGINSNFVNYSAQTEVQTATAGQTVFTLTTINYSPGTNTLSVFVDGVNQYLGTSYVETNSTTVTFSAGLHVGAEVKFTTTSLLGGGAIDAENVAYNPPFVGATATTVEAKLSETVSVKDFGAVGDGVTDDTAAVQAAFTYIEVNGGTLLIDGICAISAPLTILAGAKWIIQGNGGSQNALKAISSMNWLIDMGNNGASYEGEMVIRDLYLNGNNLSGGINANHARYSRLENLRILQIEGTKTAIKAGNWVNRITNCVVTGGDKAVHAYSPSVGYNNNFVIDKNAFTSAYGVYMDPALIGGTIGYPNNMVIRDNSFDVCTKAAIFGPNGFSRGLIISGNYIEACGGDAVSVETSSGVFANRYGAMIFPRNINAGSLGWHGLRIYDNEFLTCCQSAPAGNKYCINLENPTDTSIYNNVVYPGDTYDGLIGLSGVGAANGDVYDFSVRHADPEGTLSQLIKNDVTTSSGYGNFRAKFINVAGSQQYSLPDIFANMASWTVAGPLTVTQSFSNGLNVINFNRSTGANTYFEETNANRLKMWHNRYLRFNGVNQFVTPIGGNNLNVKVEIDVGAGYVTVLDIARTDNGPVTAGEMFFVPPNATKIKVTVSPTVPGEINVYDLKLIDPSVSL